MNKKLYIASIGMNFEDISIKTLNLIKKSDLVISDFPTENNSTIIKKLNKNFIMINKQLPKNLSKSVEYLHKTILEYFKKYKTVLYLTHGNPLYLNKRNILLYHRLKNEVETQTIPSVSSFDYIIDIICKKLMPENAYIIYTYPIEDILNVHNNIIIFNPNLIKNLTYKNIRKMISLYPKNYRFYTIQIKTIYEK
jgi:precorrin-2 methylase